MKIQNRIIQLTKGAIKTSVLGLVIALTTTTSHANIDKIIHLINTPGSDNLESARTRAIEQATSDGSTLGYHSTADEDYQTFSGTYKLPELPENIKGQYLYKLAIFSDDGCNVTVDEKLVHSRYRKGQALPKINQSFYPLDIELTPGKSVQIKVDYSNTHYIPKPNAPDIDGCTLFVYLERIIPFHIVELAPKIKDEDGNPIKGSEKPNIGLPLTPFVEEDPHTNRIAHREIKLKFDEAYAGKKITWSLSERPGATPAAIRGEWSDSPTHKDRFEESITYGKNGFEKVPQEQASTLVAKDGHTAIRMNIPPIGFNQSRIKIQIEGIEEPFDLIDMEVPAVVVIDPGHGGEDPGAIGRTDKTIKEMDLALEYSLSLKQKIVDKFSAEKREIKIIMTRDTSLEFMENSLRAKLARDKGTDVFVSIHFNSSEIASARGTETLVRGMNNVNETEDTKLAKLFLTSAYEAVKSQDENAINRGVKNYAWSPKDKKNIPSSWAVLSDSHYGQNEDYHPIRGSIIEVEFLSNETSLELIKLKNESGKSIKSHFTNAIAVDIYNDILVQP